MKEYYVSYECAKRLHELGFDGADKYYVTENFCLGDNPYFFDTFSVGDLVDGHIVYFVNENNEDDYRGIPAPRIDQAQAWLRDCKGIDVLVFNCSCGYGWEISKADPESRGTGIAIFDGEGEDENSGMWLSYEKALSAGIDKALELLTNKS